VESTPTEFAFELATGSITVHARLKTFGPELQFEVALAFTQASTVIHSETLSGRSSRSSVAELMITLTVEENRLSHAATILVSPIVDSVRSPLRRYSLGRGSAGTARGDGGEGGDEPVARRLRSRGPAKAPRQETDAAAAPPEERDDVEYLVWYGTHRKPGAPDRTGVSYTGERDQTVHYGTCKVFIPRSHKIGSLGSSWLRRVLTRTDDRLKLLETVELAGDDYWTRIQSHLAGLAASERHAVIFIHGYNVAFADAALRAAQIGIDLSIKGTMAFYSWPSQGRLDEYAADTATIEASEPFIADYLESFVNESKAEAVHIIAHSMGNRGVLRAVNRIAARAEARTGTRFNQIILAAPDVDADTFRQLCDAYAKVARRTTLYMSQRDRAVEASRWLYSAPRVGYAPPIFVAPGIDTVNVTNVDVTRLGHGYVADARSVLEDMHALITRDAAPATRFGLYESQTADGDRYWVIGA
jgi:esterase/lipase superfamily enzyme